MSDLKTAALEYHAQPRPGKLSVELTKPTATARDLALAYSPGVAEPVREIGRDPELAYKYTGKLNRCDGRRFYSNHRRRKLSDLCVWWWRSGQHAEYLHKSCNKSWSHKYNRI